jgi:chromosome segregation ATPase
MKSNIGAILLVAACLGLGFVLWNQNQTHAVQTRDLDTKIHYYSNNVSGLEVKLNRQVFSNSTLEASLAATRLKDANELAEVKAILSSATNSLQRAQADVSIYSNHVITLQDKLDKEVSVRTILETNLAKASNSLAATTANLSTTTASLQTAQDEARAAKADAASARAAYAEKDKRIRELEAQNAELDKTASDLTNSFANIQAQIEVARKKLAASDGDTKFLRDELKLVEAQKGELERKLSDLAFLKEQIKTTRDNLATGRRLDWIRQGLYDAVAQKAGEHMMNPPVPGSPATNTPLDVELHDSGGVKINSSASTNAPSAAKSSTATPSVRAPSTNAPSTNAPSTRTLTPRQPPDLGL